MTTGQTSHPLEVLGIIAESFEVDSKITRGTTKEELKEIKEGFTDQHEIWDLQWKRSLKAHEIAEPELTTLSRQFKKVRRRLCMKLISTEFRRKYEDEFAVIQGSSDFFALLESILGKVTPADSKKDAENKLEDISRRVKDEETFTRFLERIERLAHIASSGETNLKTYFVKRAFSSNLTPDQKRYLLDHSKQDETPAETAKFLDTRQKHRNKPTIKAVSAGEIQLQEQVEALTKQLAAVPELIRDALGQSVNQMVSTQMASIRDEIGTIKENSSRPDQNSWMERLRQEREIAAIRDEIGAIRKISSRPESEIWKEQQRQERADHVEAAARFTRTNTSDKHQRDHSDESRRESRRKERCKRCGYTNHKTEECRGGSTKVCYVCDKVGHMSFVCPLKQRISKN